jgi:integrase
MENQQYKEAVLKDRNGDLSKRWYIEFYCLNATTGKLQRYPIYIAAKYKTGAERTKFAKELIIEINKKLRQGYMVDSFENELTISELESKDIMLLPAFIKAIVILKAARKVGKSQNAYDTVSNIFHKFLEINKFTDLKISEFTSYHSQLYSNYMIVDRKNSNTTRNGMYNQTKAVFEYFIRLQYIDKNPFNEGNFQERKSISNLGFTLEQKQRIEEYMLENDIRLYYYTRFIYYLGTRVQETLELKVADIDFGRQTIRLPEDTAKSSVTVFQPIPEPLWELIIELGLNKLQRNHYIFGENLETGSKRSYANYPYNKHRKILDTLCIYDNTKRSKYTLYSWKGTGADRAIAENPDMDILEIKGHLRHKKLDTTQTYVKARGLKINEAMKKRRW